jgi:serine protein kinase
MVDAIGEPDFIDTSKDERLGRIFANRTIKIYPAFADFYGMEDTIERIVGYFRYAAQGLEERKQILYLLGPVGGGKSSLAERLKKLMEMRPVYTLKVGNEISPVFESPLGLFNPDRMSDLLEDKYGIARRRLNGLISPWASKRLDELAGDVSKFNVVKITPSRLRQVGIAKTEPGDENNQDVSALVGKVDIRQLENYSQSDPDAYSYSGGLNRTTQGLLEFVEMFKAPIKVLHPLLTATQEGSYNGTENFGAFPYQGIVVAHSNESEWLVAAVQEQQEQRGLPRPHPGGQGALLPARHRGAADLREAAARKRARQGALRTRSARYPQPVHRLDPARRARQLAALHEDAGL